MKLYFQTLNFIYPGARDSSTIRRLSANNTHSAIQLEFTFSLSRHTFVEEMLSPRCSLPRALILTTFNVLVSLYSLQTLSSNFFFSCYFYRANLVYCLWYLILLFDLRLTKQKARRKIRKADKVQPSKKVFNSSFTEMKSD